VSCKESTPSSIRNAELVDAGREFFAEFHQTGVDFSLGRVCGFQVLFANLLLNESAANQLLKGTLTGENRLANYGGVKNREPNFVVDIAGQNGVVVDDRDHAVEHDR
jgi:hypothetical protein